MTTTPPVLAWHFCAERDGRPIMRDGTPVVAGETVRHTGPLVLCESGYHASVRAIDALDYAPGAWVQRVECDGETIAEDDKLDCRERTCLWVADATRSLHEFALDEAERALALIESPEPRSVEALAVKRRWLDGDATDAELAAARDAAWDVARAAANGRLTARLESLRGPQT